MNYTIVASQLAKLLLVLSGILCSIALFSGAELLWGSDTGNEREALQALASAALVSSEERWPTRLEPPREVDSGEVATIGERELSSRQLLKEALVPGRQGHFQLDLPQLATRILTRNGVDYHQIGLQHRVCTICNPDRFDSYRRDGVEAGRLTHFVTNPLPISD